MTRRAVWMALCLALLPMLLAQPALARKPKAQVSSEAPALSCPASVVIGEPFVVRVKSQKPLKGARIEFLGRSAPLDLRQEGQSWAGFMVLGADVLDGRPGRQAVTLRFAGGPKDGSKGGPKDGSKGGSKGGPKGGSERCEVELKTMKRPVESLTLDPAMVQPPAEALGRIARERGVVRQALAAASPVRMLRLPLSRPGQGEMSSEYGIGRVLNGIPKAPHRGLDLEAAIGDEVTAAADGVVLLSAELYYAGNCVYLDHGQGLVTMYFHLSQRRVEPGQRVARGQLLGLAGDTGRSTRSHLHFGVSALGRLVDPGPLLEYGVLP